MLGSNESKFTGTIPDMTYNIEKRLQTLRRQLYGKEVELRSVNTRIDTNYLQKDLLKILILATLAIAAQILLKLVIPRYDWTIWKTKLF